jgi:esterase/lipase superfamily enzyme
MRMFTELYNEMRAIDAGDLLFFVHGFHTDLEGVLKSVCDLEEKYICTESPIKHLVVFTWPAMNKLLRYRNDARDAELSGFTLAPCYQMLIDFFRVLFLRDHDSPPLDPCGKNIHLMAHSMGNRVIESIMLELNRQSGITLRLYLRRLFLQVRMLTGKFSKSPEHFTV